MLADQFELQLQQPLVGQESVEGGSGLLPSHPRPAPGGDGRHRLAVEPPLARFRLHGDKLRILAERGVRRPDACRPCHLADRLDRRDRVFVTPALLQRRHLLLQLFHSGREPLHSPRQIADVLGHCVLQPVHAPPQLRQLRRRLGGQGLRSRLLCLVVLQRPQELLAQLLARLRPFHPLHPLQALQRAFAQAQQLRRPPPPVGAQQVL